MANTEINDVVKVIKTKEVFYQKKKFLFFNYSKRVASKHAKKQS